MPLKVFLMLAGDFIEVKLRNNNKNKVIVTAKQCKSVTNLTGVVITISVGLLLYKSGWQISQSNIQSCRRLE